MRRITQHFLQLSPAAAGILLYVSAIFAMSLMDLTAKTLSTEIPVLQVLWARYAGQTLIVLAVFAPRLGAVARTRSLGKQVLRSTFLMGATGLFFLSVSRMGLAEATALMDVNPVLITLGAALFLGEKVGPHRVLGIAAALIGALVVIRPGSDVFSFSALLPIAAATCYASFALFSRAIGNVDGVQTSMLYAGLVGAVVLSFVVPGVWVTPSPRVAALMVLIGFIGATGQFLLIRAFMLAEASAIAPFSYVGLLFAASWGWLFFGDLPDLPTWIGGGIIVASGIYIWHRERQKLRA